MYQNILNIPVLSQEMVTQVLVKGLLYFESTMPFGDKLVLYNHAYLHIVDFKL